VAPGEVGPDAGRVAARVAVPGEGPGADLPATGDSAAPRTAFLARRGYRPWPALWPRYWLPVGVAQGSGAWAGVFTSGQDALERHAYSASVMAGTGLAAGTWRADVAYQYAGLTRAVLDAAYSRSETIVVQPAGGPPPGPANDTTSGRERCCGRSEDASLGVTVRQRRFRWSAAARLGAEY